MKYKDDIDEISDMAIQYMANDDALSFDEFIERCNQIELIRNQYHVAKSMIESLIIGISNDDFDDDDS